MSKAKGPTWEQVYRPAADKPVRSLEYQRSRTYAEVGRSWFEAVCPFCQADVKCYVWSICGAGKRCDCGALIGRRGMAHHWASAAEVRCSNCGEPKFNGRCANGKCIACYGEP